MDEIRREFLKLSGIAALVAPAMLRQGARSAIAPIASAGAGTVFDVRSFGAVGDGKTIVSPAINRAIEAAGAKGGTMYLPAGTYACYSLRLKSAVALYLGWPPGLLGSRGLVSPWRRHPRAVSEQSEPLTQGTGVRRFPGGAFCLGPSSGAANQGTPSV